MKKPGSFWLRRHFHNSSSKIMLLLIINGESKEVASTSLKDLFVELSLPAPLMLVEHNGKALLRSQWESVALSAGDRLELMKVAAGG